MYFNKKRLRDDLKIAGLIMLLLVLGVVFGVLLNIVMQHLWIMIVLYILSLIFGIGLCKKQDTFIRTSILPLGKAHTSFIVEHYV